MISGTVKVTRKKHRELPKLKGRTRVKVGYPAGTAKKGVIMKAIWNHYGTRRGIPPRPWLYIAMRKNREKYRRYFKAFAAKIVGGELTLENSLRLLGEAAKTDVQKSLIALRTPANAPATLRAKAPRTNPLIDTGEMNQATTYEVID